MNFVYRGLQCLAFFSVLAIFSGMTDCGDSRKISPTGDPNFTPLVEGQGCYEAFIIDELARIEVKEISFSGTTKIGGVLYEENDATGILEIEGLIGKTVRIIDDNYKSVRHPEKSVFKARIIHSVLQCYQKGISNLSDVEICGIEKKSGKVLFKADILDGKNITIIQNSEILGIDKKSGKTLFNAKVFEVADKLENGVQQNNMSEDNYKDILIPRDTVICGVDKRTGACMAWLLRKIDSIEFKKPDISETPEAKINVKFKKAVDVISRSK